MSVYRTLFVMVALFLLGVMLTSQDRANRNAGGASGDRYLAALKSAARSVTPAQDFDTPIQIES